MKARSARVLLTGASGGIGAAMRTQLEAAGAEVLGVGRRPGLSGEPWVQADLASAEGRQAVVAAAALWRPNVVVQAAGLPAFGRVEEQSPQALQRMLEMNLLVPMLLSQALLPQLRLHGESRLIFVGSALGRIGLPGFSAYGASKAGLYGFAEALRRELADTPVRVQLLAPRSTRTAFNDETVEAYNAQTGTASDEPQRVAQALIDLLESGAAVRTLGFPERLGVRLNALLGPWMDASFTKHRRSLNAPVLPHNALS